MLIIILILLFILNYGETMKKVAVIGSGDFGTAISQILSKNTEEVILYSRRKEITENIAKSGYNIEYYPNTKLNENIKATSDLADIDDCEVIFLSIPSSAIRKTLEVIKTHIKGKILVSVAKGIEYPSLKTMGKIIEEYTAEYVVLSGPNFASEIILDLNTITNISAKNLKNAEIVKKILETDKFKVKIIEDIIGTEFCGIMKNINAIAYGICEGMNIGENGRYAILTKGFEDTKKILSAIGGNSNTLDTYCGFGDLILTSTSKESRNHTLGTLYGQKLIVSESSGVIFEGKNSIESIKKLCEKNSIESPIVDFVYGVIVEKITPPLAFKDLWDKI